MERWVEHDYSELSARENMVSLEVLNAIDCLPVLEDLDSGDLLSGAERGPGVPAPGKARGQDGNTLPVVEAREGRYYSDERRKHRVTLYKNKGARRACNNYQGISLLSIAIKLFARVVLKGLQVLAERFYP